MAAELNSSVTLLVSRLRFYSRRVIEVPASFRAMPRWWSEGTGWLDALPMLAAAQCERWALRPDGKPRHGSNALVLPVRRDEERLALRLSPPGPDLATTVASLDFWSGRGTVELVATDPDRGALLLEWLDADRSLACLPPAEAFPIIGRTIRRLAVPAPTSVRSTGEEAIEEADGWRQRWSDLGEPIPARVLDTALASVRTLAEPETPELAVDADLHFEQVLAGVREPWLVVDPVLLRGDIGYDLGRILWSRLDELGNDAAVRRWFDILVEAAGLDVERARRWVVTRATSYLFWGLEHGLTEDPPRCLRLLDIFADRPT
jgi:streptomycin 6-kinase